MKPDTALVALLRLWLYILRPGTWVLWMVGYYRCSECRGRPRWATVRHVEYYSFLHGVCTRAHELGWSIREVHAVFAPHAPPTPPDSAHRLELT